MAEFEINGIKYRSGKLDAMRQLILAKRLAPVVGGILKLLQGVTAGTGDEDVLSTFGQAIGSLSDEDTRFIVSECLSVTDRDVGEGRGWARVQASGGGLMYDDIDLSVMIQIVFRVVMENLSPTIASARQNLTGRAGA